MRRGEKYQKWLRSWTRQKQQSEQTWEHKSMESCRCLWFKEDCSERWIQKVRRLAPGWNMWTSVWFFRTSQRHLKRIYLAGLAGKAALPTPDLCTASSWQALKWVGVRARAPWRAMPVRIATFLALAEALLRAWYQRRGENLKTLSPSCFSTPRPFHAALAQPTGLSIAGAFFSRPPR